MIISCLISLTLRLMFLSRNPSLLRAGNLLGSGRTCLRLENRILTLFLSLGLRGIGSRTAVFEDLMDRLSLISHLSFLGIDLEELLILRRGSLILNV